MTVGITNGQYKTSYGAWVDSRAGWMTEQGYEAAIAEGRSGH